MAIRTYKLTLDSKNYIAPEPVYLRQGDKTGAVVIDATLMDNGSPVPLDGLTPSFMANTADGQEVIADSTGFNIVNASGGEFTYQVSSKIGSVPGKIRIAYFSFADASGNQSTFDVAFIINKAADMTKESAKDWISSLSKIIEQYNQWSNDAHNSWEQFVNENKAIIESIDPGGKVLSELIDFRHSDMLSKTFDTAKLRGDFFDNDLRDRGVNAKWYGAAGDGIKDDTAAIQASFDAAHNIFIPAGSYLIDATIGLKPQNNSTIILDERAILKVKTNSSTGYHLFDLENCADINISGGQLVGDKDDHDGETGEWGMGINLKNSQNIKIKRMQINKFWGDGIYIGGTGYENRSQNILIDDVTLDANRRQGISVINVEGLKIPKVTITNTAGTGPAAGIDFEPNSNGEVLKNIDIGDLITNNNDHAGVLIVLNALFDDSGENLYNVDTSQIDIRINKISSRNDLYGLFLMSDQTSGYKVYGNILINALNVENSNSNGIRSENYKTVHTPHVRIAKAYIKNANYSNQFPNHPNGAGVYFKADGDVDGSTANNLISYGNTDIDKIEVMDELDNTVRGLHFQVAGEFNVINARIEKYVTNQVLVKQSYINKFIGTIEQINYLPETLSTATVVEKLICHDLIYDLSNSSITLPKASFYKGSTILIRNQNGVTGDKMANIKTASGDLILVSSSGIANGSTDNIMLKSSNGFVKLASLGGNQWLMTDSSGYISYPTLYGPVSTYYNSILPASFPNGAQVGDRVINIIPRSGVPAEWVCTAAGNPGTWIGLNTLN